MPLVKINDVELEVAAGTTVLEAAKSVGIEIPHYCYHPALKIVASCRMCLVKIQGFPKLVPSCSTRINPMPPERKFDGKYDMVVDTVGPEVKDEQESVLEFLLLNHPVDCPECDQAGECFLQDYSYDYGKDRSRFEFAKRVPPRKDLGPNILLISTRCILCSRCVRFTQEITGTHELLVKNRGAHAEIDLFPGTSLDNKLSMCTADICPVGALVTKDFLYKPRNWNYRKKRTVCPGCSVGCNVTVEYREEENQIFRITPAQNDAVNQWWACDEGRLLYHQFEKAKRLEFPQLREGGELKRANWRQAYGALKNELEKFQPAEIAVVGSGYATNEESYLLRRLAQDGLKTKNIALFDGYRREEDVVYPYFTIKGEKAPNLQGANDVLQPTMKFSQLVKKIDAGKIKAVYFLGGDPNIVNAKFELDTWRKLDILIVQDMVHSPLTDLANILLPGATAYEKEGTFTNYQGRIQRIRRVLLPPAAAKSDFEILREVSDLFELPFCLHPKNAFSELSETVQGYGGADYARLGELGMAKGEGVAETTTPE